MFEFLYVQSEVAIGLSLLLLLMIAYEVSYRLGAWMKTKGSEPPSSPVQAIQGALLGLVGLMLGFSFAMAGARFESRKAEVVGEANAIGTAYLRAQLLHPPHREEISRILKEYVDSRVHTYENVREKADMDAALNEFQRLHDDLWAETIKVASDDQRGPIVSLFIASVNEVIDRHGTRIASHRNRVPEPVLALLLLLCMISTASIGYGGGLGGARHLLPAVVFAVLLVLVVSVILDFDRPRRGLIRVDQTSLLELQSSMKPVAP